jgi:Beta-galactosidase
MNQQSPQQHEQPQLLKQRCTLWLWFRSASQKFRIGVECCILIALCSFSSCASAPAPVIKSSPTPTSSQYSSFKGIIQFRGEDDPNGASNPYLAGANITFYWSQLEPQKRQYKWDVVDQAIKPWIDHGKKIILRVSASGWTHWHPPYSGRGTPQWMYDLGVPSVTEVDGSVLPQYWNPIFLRNLNDFIHAMAQRYDGNPHIAFVQVALGIGGESKVDSHNDNPRLLQLWQSIGYTDALWWDAVQQIIAMYTASFHATPLAIMPDKTFIGETAGYHESLLLNYAAQQGLWEQDNGLFAGRTLPSIWMTVPHAEEQIAPTKQTGDTLLADLQTALNLGANYVLVFTSDIDNPANQSALQWAASLAHQ